MSGDGGLVGALEAAGRCATITARRSLSGGCIHRVEALELADGSTVVAKIGAAAAAALFEAEAIGLRRLAATGTVLVPEPLGVHRTSSATVLLLARVTPAPATAAAWRRLGEELAALHAADAGSRYGFDVDNHLGTTPQPNGWSDDWVEFNRRHRIGHQVELAAGRGLLRPAERRDLRTVMEALDRLLPRRPHPALLHGDLWSGNALPTRDGDVERIAVIDPACSIGDGWADVAMMRLFGGFDEACFQAYAARVDDHDRVESRIDVYQLYHVLNHVNIFGRGYARQAMALAGRLLDRAGPP